VASEIKTPVRLGTPVDTILNLVHIVDADGHPLCECSSEDAERIIATLNAPVINVQLCPNCQGQKIVSRPPNVAGDVNEWTTSDAIYPWEILPCPTCGATGYIPVYIERN